MAPKEAEAVKKGLAGVVAGETKITLIDGNAGILLYRGYRIQDLADHCSFEEVVYLLWNSELPNQKQLTEFSAALAAERSIPQGLIELIRRIPKGTPTMPALRTMVSALAHFDPESENNAIESLHHKSLQLVAKLPTLVAAFHRIQQGLEPVPPRKELSHAANLLYMLSGKEPDASVVRPVDAYLVLLADHDFNASTFAGRITVGTFSDIYSATVTSIGTLKGPLHGGAGEAVMKMLLEVGDQSKAEAYVDGIISSGGKIMGFGHRVYRTWDPRGKVLREIYVQSARTPEQKKWLGICQIIERQAHERKHLFFNVDFYAAPVLFTAGLPVDLFSPMFAISRMAGYAAHYLEQYQDNRLIRPLSDYQGPAERNLIPLDQRV